MSSVREGVRKDARSQERGNEKKWRQEVTHCSFMEEQAIRFDFLLYSESVGISKVVIVVMATVEIDA